jgi:DNA mismatch repair ATPase MutS
MDKNNNRNFLIAPWRPRTPLREIYKEGWDEYPDHIIFIQNGCFWEAAEHDAEYLFEHLGWKTHNANYDRRLTTGTGIENEHFESQLKELGKGYVLIAQIDEGDSKPARGIIYVFTP